MIMVMLMRLIATGGGVCGNDLAARQFTSQ